MNTKTCASLYLTERQYFAINTLFFDKNDVPSPLVKSIPGTDDFVIHCLRNIDMWAIVDLLRELGLWYNETYTYKYAHEGH